MNVGSLFSGIGGFDLGLERAGMRVAWQCESEPYRRAVLRKHWPGVPCYEDVRTLTGENAESVGLVCGGFPCKDISVAGDQAGIDGEHSGLWAEMFRVVGELRPRYVVVENVAALTRWLGRVVGDLAAIGYDAEWDCIRASDVGACHGRARLWLVAYPGGAGRREDTGSASRHAGPNEGRAAEDHHESVGVGSSGLQAAALEDSNGSALEPRWERGRAPQAATALADADSERRLQQEGPLGPERGRVGNGDGEAFDWGIYEPVIRRWEHVHGVPAPFPFVRGVDARLPCRLDRLSALGDSLVPQIAEWIGRRILEAEEERLAA